MNSFKNLLLHSSISQHLPQVHYRCHCEKTLTFLYNLYFCPVCHALKCARCIQEYPTQFYCPACLFEVPSTSLKTEKNGCTRNCFECPLCHSTLLALLLSSESETKHHYLQCVTCRWDSRQIGLTFDQPSGFGSFILKKEEEMAPWAKTFQDLMAYWSHPKKTKSKQKQKQKHKSESQNENENENENESESEKHPDVVNPLPLTLTPTPSSFPTTPLDWPWNQSFLLPLRKKLRAKCVKKCGQCDTVLVHPTTKPSSLPSTPTQVLHSAWSVIPHLHVEKFNPQDVPSQVHFSLHHSYPRPVDICIVQQDLCWKYSLLPQVDLLFTLESLDSNELNFDMEIPFTSPSLLPSTSRQLPFFQKAKEEGNQTISHRVKISLSVNLKESA